MNWYRKAQEEHGPIFDWGKIENSAKRLEKKAESLCKKKNHLLSPFIRNIDTRTGEELGHTTCMNCRLWIHYRTGSELNGTQPKIEGPALKLECESHPHGHVVFDPAYQWDEGHGDFVLRK